MGLMTPRQIKSNIVFDHVYRFVSSSGTATAITVTGLAGASGTMGVATNAVVHTLYESVILRSVEIFSPPASQGSSVTCSILWEGTVNSPEMEVSDTSVSVAKPAHVHSSAPEKSLGSFWNQIISANNPTLCTIVAPSGSIIDVSLGLILSDEGSASQGISVTTCVGGEIYYLALDGPSTHIYTPVSLNTTF
jgi:hypothetical protein